MRETDNAMFGDRAVLAVDAALIEQIKRRAAGASPPCYRLCLHASPAAPFHHMLIASGRDHYVPPHRHAKPVSFIAVEGDFTVLVFDDNGNVAERIDVSPDAADAACCVHLASNVWYSEIFHSEWVVMHELTPGPYDRERTNEYAHWAPRADDAAGAAAFLERHRGGRA